jgi:hypothetical protein
MKWKDYLKRKKYTTIRLKRTKSAHLVIKARINCIKGRFILDTGASNTCIDIAKASYFNVMPKESEQKATGAGSTGIEMHEATEVSFAMGPWKFDNLHLALLDLSHINSAFESIGESPVEGVVGADVLFHSGAIIHYGKKRLYVRKRIFRF